MPRLTTGRATTALVAAGMIAASLPEGSHSVSLRASIVVVVWSAVIAGVATMRFPRSEVPRAAVTAGALLAALAVWTGLSMLWADDHGRAFAEITRPAGYLGVFALVVCASARGEARSWLNGLAIGIAGVALLALGSRLVPALPGSDSEIMRLIPAAEGRLSYPIGYWNGLATLVGIGIVLLTWIGAAGRTRAGRALALAALPSLALVVYLTSSRGAAVTAGAGIAVLVAIGPYRFRTLAGATLAALPGAVLISLASDRPELLEGAVGDIAERQGIELLLAAVATAIVVGAARFALDRPIGRVRTPRRYGFIALGLAAVLACVAVVASDPAERLDEFREPPAAEASSGVLVTEHFSSSSGSGRYQFWKAAINAFESEPLHGIGAGGYGPWWTEHASIDHHVRDAHSIYLETLAELGVPGLLLLLGFLVAAPVAVWRRRWPGPPDPATRGAALAIVATGALSAGIDWTWELPAVFVPVVVGIALLTGPPEAPQALQPATGTARPTPGWRLGAGLAGFAAIWVAANVLLFEATIKDSRKAARANDLEQAAGRANDAIAIQPFSAEARLQLALIQEQHGDLDQAAASVRLAINRAENDWELWLVLARIQTQSGNLPAARDALAEARRLNPRLPYLGP